MIADNESLDNSARASDSRYMWFRRLGGVVLYVAPQSEFSVNIEKGLILFNKDEAYLALSVDDDGDLDLNLGDPSFDDPTLGFECASELFDDLSNEIYQRYYDGCDYSATEQLFENNLSQNKYCRCGTGSTMRTILFFIIMLALFVLKIYMSAN